VTHVKNIADKLQHYEAMKSPTMRKTPSKEDDEMYAMRRKLHAHILKNQYSYWAGMYVKRLPGGGFTAGRPSAEDVI
jgi:hypothetical protein